jgi:hypothetical protein
MPFFPLGVGAHAKPDAAVAAAAQHHRVKPHPGQSTSSRSIHLTPDEVHSIAATARTDPRDAR